MKKITYISLLFFITSIFCLFMWFFGLKNTFAYEMKLWNLWEYNQWLYVNTATWLYNNQFYWIKTVSTDIVYLKLYNSVWSEVRSDICRSNYGSSNVTNCVFNTFEIKNYYIINFWWVRGRSYPTEYSVVNKTLIVNKKDWSFNLLDFWFWGTSFSWYNNRHKFYYKDNILYFFLWNKYYSLTDNWVYDLVEISNPWFTFLDFSPFTFNNFKFQYLSEFNRFYIYNNTTTLKEVIFSLNNYSIIDISLPNSFANKKSMNVIWYDGKTYFSQESSTGDLQIIWCNSDLTGCASFPNEYYLYFNYTQKKWYKITKTDYDAKNIKNLNWYYGFYDSDSSSYMKWYIKNDSFLYVDNSSLDVFWWGSSSWNTTCTENSSNCTCIWYTPSTYDLELKNDYSVYGNNLTDYSTGSTDSKYFRFKKLTSPQNTLDFTFWDFSAVNFYDSWWLAIFNEDQKYISFLNWWLNLENWFFKKNELNIKNYSGAINFIQLDSLQDYNFNLYWLNKKWEKELIWNFKTNTPNYLQNTYFNLSIEFDWYQFWWYSVKKILLREYNKNYWEDQKICYDTEKKQFTIDWEVTDFNVIDNLDPNIINDIITWKIDSIYKEKIFDEVESVINSNNLWNMDVSWSWMIISTMWTELNPIVAWNFWTGSCRMFWDNLQFLYYSNWQMTFNFSFWDFDNMFLDWLSFLWEKIIWVFTTPLQNMVSFVTILTPFWTSDKNYCIFWTVMTYTPHKMFIWTEFHNKMILIDYLVLFAYWTFLIWSLSLMHWIVWFIPPISQVSQVEEKQTIVNNWTTALTVRGNTSVASNSRDRNQKALWQWKEYKPYGSYKIYR